MEIVLQDQYAGYSANSPAFNIWVDRQRAYILSLPLEVRDSIAEWDHDSKQFLDPLGYRMIQMLDMAIQSAPSLPLDLLVFKSLRDIAFLPFDIEDAIGRIYTYESFYATTVQRSYAEKFLRISAYSRRKNYIMHILLKAGMACLYIHAYIDEIGELILPRRCSIQVIGVREQNADIILECIAYSCPIPSMDRSLPMNDDEYLLAMAKWWLKFSIGLDTRSWSVESWIEVPVWDQDRVELDRYDLPEYPLKQSLGSAGSGFLIICDGLYLSIRMNTRWESSLYWRLWDIPGGGTSRGVTSPVKAHYTYRMYLVHVTRRVKKIINKAIRLGPMYDVWRWHPIPMHRSPGLRFQAYALAWRMNRGDRHPILSYILDHLL